MIHLKQSKHNEFKSMFHRRAHSLVPTFIVVLLLGSVVYILYINNSLQVKFDIIEAKAKRYKSEHHALTSRLQAVSEERSKLKDSLDKEKAVRTNLNFEMQQNKEIHETLIEELNDKHESKYQSLVEEHGDVKEELNKAKMELYDLQEAKKLLEQKSLTHQQLVKSHESKRKLLEEENTKLQEQYNQLSDQHTRNKEYLNQVNSRLLTAEEELQNFNKLKGALQKAGVNALDLQHSRFNQMSASDRQLLLSHLGENAVNSEGRADLSPRVINELPYQVIPDVRQQQGGVLDAKQPVAFHKPSVELQESQTNNIQQPMNVPNQQGRMSPVLNRIGNGIGQLHGGVPQGAKDGPQESVLLNGANEDHVLTNYQENDDDQNDDGDNFEGRPDSPKGDEGVVENNVVVDEDSDLEDQNYANQMDKDGDAEESEDGDDLENDEDTQIEGFEVENNSKKESLNEMYEVDSEQKEQEDPQPDEDNKEPVFNVAELSDEESKDDLAGEEDERATDAGEEAADDDYDGMEESKDSDNEMEQHPDGREEEVKSVIGAPGSKSNEDENYEEEEYDEDDDYNEQDGKKLTMEDDEKYVQDQDQKDSQLPAEEDYEDDPEEDTNDDDANVNDEDEEELSDADRRHDEAVRLAGR